MAEWLYEAGIGEARAALIEHGVIQAARIEPNDETLRIGTVARAQISEIVTKGREALARLEDGTDLLLAPHPPSITQGASLLVEITRLPLLESRRGKRARATPAVEGAVERIGDDLLARITASGIPVRRLRAHEPDAFEAAGWSEVIEEARTGDIQFTGGALRLALTPAMTLIDVDGAAPLDKLAVAAAHAAALAIQRHDIGGSIGIDFPTLAGREPRQAVAKAIDDTLAPPFERTAMNGFGFLQIVRRRLRPSLPERLRDDPHGAAVRAVLRQIERTPPPGERSYRLPPAQLAVIRAHPEWTEELARRTGVVTAFLAQENHRS